VAGDERARKQLQSENYTVTWGAARTFEPEAELEIGDGNGHGGTLGWLRFKPGKDGVDVLSIQFDEGWRPYKSKWPPDRAPVAVRRARLKPDAYAALLRDLATIDSARLKPVERNGSTFSTHDFWVSARLATGRQTLLTLDWAGYEGSGEELSFAKPRAAVRLAREAVGALEFREHTLTAEERAWAGAKFARDWKRYEGAEFHWWVRERYIQTIGVVGDETALPVLRDVLAAEPPKGEPRAASDRRCVYLAINAATRLTGKDVRDKPVEEMDVEKTRRKVLELIPETRD
jgi:hypothetical protein